MEQDNKGGTCKNIESSLSFKGLNKKLQFETYEEFCNRADEILDIFRILIHDPRFSMVEYKNYIYYQHKFCESFMNDLAAKDKCFEWLMSYEYEYISKNDLYAMLGKIREEK